MQTHSKLTPAKKSGVFYGYWILLACFLCQFLMNGCSFYSFSLYVKPLTTHFGWSRGLIMGANTAGSLAMGLTSPLAGLLTYRFGARRVIASGAILSGLVFAFLSLMNSLWQFYLLEIIMGVAATLTGVIPGSMVIGNWFKKRRGFAIGILGMGIGVGGFVMPRIIGIYLIPAFTWRGALLISGILVSGLLTPMSLAVIRARPEDMGLHPDGTGEASPDNNKTKLEDANKGLTHKEAYRTTAFWLMALSFTTFGLSNSALFQNQVPYLEDIGFKTAVAAGAFSFVGIGSAIGKFGFGWLCDFIPAKFTLVTGIACQIVAVATLLSVKLSSPEPVLWFAALMFGLGVGSWLPALSMTVSDTFGMVSYGTIFGVMNLIFQTGGAVGPTIAGFIYDLNKSYFWAFIMTLVLYAISLPSILLVRRPKTVKKP